MILNIKQHLTSVCFIMSRLPQWVRAQLIHVVSSSHSRSFQLTLTQFLAHTHVVSGSLSRRFQLTLTQILAHAHVVSGSLSRRFQLTLTQFLAHTQTHHIRQDCSGKVISPSHRTLPENTQQPLGAPSPLCHKQLGRGCGGALRHNTTVMYLIYYTEDDMFRPLRAIFRSQILYRGKL